MLAVLALMFGGALLPIQTTFNSRLRISVGSPYLSSLFSFAGGTIFLAVLTWALTGSLLFPASAVAGQPGWIWIGGLLGVIGLTTNILVFPKIGGVQAVILPITGQILMGLIIDQWGLFGSPQVPLTSWRLGGAVLVLIGVLTAVRGGQHQASSRATTSNQQSDAGSLIWWQLFAVFTGFLMATQSAINARLGTVVGSGLKAALISFAVGTVLLFALACALRLKVRVRVPEGQRKNPFWMWLGGPLGACYVTLNALLVPVLGTGTAVVATLAGMISLSLIVDKFGIFQAPQRPVRLVQVAGVVVILLGVVLIRLTF